MAFVAQQTHSKVKPHVAVSGCLRQGEKRLILIDKEFEIRILFSVPFSTFDIHSPRRDCVLRPLQRLPAHCCEEGA